jgi:molybdopterin-guanine dinucleotide biosynthesis protein B
MHELRGGPELSLDEALERLSPCDLALVEGYKAYPIPKLEIWRAEVGKPLLHPRDLQILAIATDSPEALPPGTAGRMPVFALSDLEAVTTFVAAQATARPAGN